MVSRRDVLLHQFRDHFVLLDDLGFQVLDLAVIFLLFQTAQVLRNLNREKSRNQTFAVQDLLPVRQLAVNLLDVLNLLLDVFAGPFFVKRQADLPLDVV